LSRRVAQRLRLRPPDPHPVAERQPWREVLPADPAAVGRQARVDVATGHATWLASLPAYRDFVTQW